MKMSYTTLALLLTGVAVLFYGAFVLYSTWSDRVDGRCRAVRNQGLHPDADDLGPGYARQEEQEDHGNNRR